MAEKTVALIAPNGQQVRVAASKQEDRLRGGYRLLEEAADGKKSRPRRRAGVDDAQAE